MKSSGPVSSGREVRIVPDVVEFLNNWRRKLLDNGIRHWAQIARPILDHLRVRIDEYPQSLQAAGLRLMCPITGRTEELRAVASDLV